MGVPPVRSASLYAAKFRGGPGPGTYEQLTAISTPRGSPRGTFGTAPQRAALGKDVGPPPDQYSPRKPGKVLGEYSFSKDSRFKGNGSSTGDPGAYNPRPRSEGRAPAAYSIKGVRDPASHSTTPGPGAHDIARFGDAEQHSHDSFHRLAQNSARFSFGTLARPLGGSMSPQQARRMGRPEPGSPSGGWIGRSGRSPKRSPPRRGAKVALEPQQPQRTSATTPRQQMHGRAGRHPLQPMSDTRRFAAEEPPAHGTVTPMDPPPPATQVANVGPGQYAMAPTFGAGADVRLKASPRYSINKKNDEPKRFISKEHSNVSMKSTSSPGPALYCGHSPLGVGVPAAVSAEGSAFSQPGAPGPPMVNSGRFVRGQLLGSDKRRAPAFGFGTASRDAPGTQLIVP